MSRALLLFGLALAACSTPQQQQPRTEPPSDLASCPGRVVVPPAPKAPRSVEQIARWGTAVDAALVKSEAARAECSRRLVALNVWLRAHAGE